uniref:hypothetical protein n=1 Tax=Escherichia coli TaxID=562 RepID=UPI002342C47F|nr:hypothetical protein [Escherichia coli]WBR56100.1 hypothetical protein CPHELBEB_00128 [Escherichia coli]
MNMVIREKPYQLMVALIALYTAIPVVTIVILSGQQSHKLELIAVHFITFITMVFVLRRKMGKRWLDLFEEKLAIYKPNDKLALSELHESIREKNGLDLQGSDSNLLIVFYVQIMPDDLVMQLHRF